MHAEDNTKGETASPLFFKNETRGGKRNVEGNEERRREAEEIAEEQMKLAGMVEASAELAHAAINAFAMAYTMLAGRMNQ